MILYGAYPRGSIKRGGSAEEMEATLTLVRQGWGRDNAAYRQLFTSQFMPEADREQMNWFNELQRVSCSPDNAALVQLVTANIDVLHRLSQVAAPTLVLHADRDARVPSEQGRQMAALMPNAEYISLESMNHLLLADEPAWAKAIFEVRRFLGVAEAAAPDAATQSSPIATKCLILKKWHCASMN